MEKAVQHLEIIFSNVFHSIPLLCNTKHELRSIPVFPYDCFIFTLITVYGSEATSAVAM